MEIAIITKKVETATGQVKRQGNAWTDFDSCGFIHMEFIPEGATVNKNHYKTILCCLRSSVPYKCPELRHRKNWLLLHNAHVHHSVLVQEELAKLQVTVLPHPPYSPDLAPCGFFFFLWLKEKQCGWRFHLAKEIATATREVIWTSLQTSSSSYTSIGRLA
jgi:hypothetical protein